MTATKPRQLPVRNPRTGLNDTYITPASAGEIRDICQRLRAAQPAWGTAPLAYRIGIMQRWVAELQRHRAALVTADSIDTGYGQISRVAPDMVINAINRTCTAAPAIFERNKRSGTSPGAPQVKFDTNLKPYPLAGIIGPWNAPLMLSTLHAIPALFAGCAVIVKPSEVAPRRPCSPVVPS
ncbi:MAG: NAD-dependent aldehyde dehydrogenase [Gammaproteobacteria bacterium]|nr:NAD-dependent aldehyde dehydrogenase [Gammaproteobacteria bacterium]